MKLYEINLALFVFELVLVPLDYALGSHGWAVAGLVIGAVNFCFWRILRPKK